MIALPLDNNLAKSYLCNQNSTASPSVSRVDCQILNLANMHGITLIPAYLPIHLSVEVEYLLQRRLIPEWHILPSIGQVSSQLWHQLGVDLLASPHNSQCQHYCTLENPLLLAALVWMLSTILGYSNELCSSYIIPALVLLVLSKCLEEHVTGQFRLHILVVPCWMEAFWLTTIPNMLEYIPHHCPSVKILPWMFQETGCSRLTLLHLMLWLLRDVCCTDWGSLHLSVRQCQGQLKYLWQKYPATARRNGLVSLFKKVYQTLSFLCPSISLFFGSLI